MRWLADKLFFWRRRYRPPLTLGQRILRVALGIVLAIVVLSVLGTLSLRFVDPPTSAFMLRSSHEARAQSRTDFRLRHYWVDWEYIAPYAKVAVIPTGRFASRTTRCGGCAARTHAARPGDA